MDIDTVTQSMVTQYSRMRHADRGGAAGAVSSSVRNCPMSAACLPAFFHLSFADTCLCRPGAFFMCAIVPTDQARVRLRT